MSVFSTIFLSSMLILSSFQLLRLGREIKCQNKEKGRLRNEFLSNLASPNSESLMRISRCKAQLKYKRQKYFHKFSYGKNEITYKADPL